MGSDLVLVISAPSGAGKTTLISRLMKADPRFMFSVSTTTRAPRPGEVDGVNYYYRSREDFEAMIAADDFLEWADVYGNYYGTSKKEVDRIRGAGRIPLFDVDVQGGLNLMKCLDAVFVFIVPPTMSSLRERLTRRETESRTDLERRIASARAELAEAAHYDYIIVNDDLEQAESDLKSIIRAEEIRSCRMKTVLHALLEES
jgi:guanylate kinase